MARPLKKQQDVDAGRRIRLNETVMVSQWLAAALLGASVFAGSSDPDALVPDRIPTEHSAFKSLTAAVRRKTGTLGRGITSLTKTEGWTRGKIDGTPIWYAPQDVSNGATMTGIYDARVISSATYEIEFLNSPESLTGEERTWIDSLRGLKLYQVRREAAAWGKC